MWMGYMMPFMPAGAAAMGSQVAASRPMVQSTDLHLELETSQRAAISLHLIEPRPPGSLRTRLLRDEGDAMFPLHFDASRIRIKIPDGQAPGTYRGVVLDGSGNQCGMMTVSVFRATPNGA
jgi:hypothetical protein